MMNFNKHKYWFSKKENSRKSGFSLIEMVVVVGSLGIIIVAVISTILLTFRSQNQIKTNNKISENGRVVLAELRRNVFNADSSTINCGVTGVGSSVSISNRKDGGVTTLVCFESNIASNSANLNSNLNSNEVVVYNCQNFVACTPKVGSTEVAAVEFNFGLLTTTTGVGSSQLFNTRVTTRN